MALSIVATPIGNLKDISARAIEALTQADIVIGEERRVASTLLKRLNIEGKRLEELNEHSTEIDIEELSRLCVNFNCALITDCGTPVFCDPGSSLIKVCRKKNVPIRTLPGPSSIMAILSLSSQRLDQFLFLGFLPREESHRNNALQSLKTEKRAIILMDTPYRLGKLMKELAQTLPDRNSLLGLNLTQEGEKVLEGTLLKISALVQSEKAEFMLLIYPEATSGGTKT